MTSCAHTGHFSVPGAHTTTFPGMWIPRLDGCSHRVLNVTDLHLRASIRGIGTSELPSYDRQ